jgi:uncharacterized membrane protein YsdA (DUF1294 family)
MVIPGVLFLGVILYLIANLIAYCAFALDKRKARHTTWRIRENTLLSLAFLGPAGAFCAMKICRHKTQKIKFYLVPVFLVLHLVVTAYLAITFL